MEGEKQTAMESVAPSQDLRELLIRMQLLEQAADQIASEAQQRLREALKPDASQPIS